MTAGIIDVIRADRAQIMYWQGRFGEVGCRNGDLDSQHAYAATWDTLASLIELHMDAEDEICQLAVYRAGPDGPARARSMLDGHEDIREIIREAQLQPPGSPLWWRLTSAAAAAWIWLLVREEHDVLDGLRGVGDQICHQLARQWQAFTAARFRDCELTAHFGL